MYKKICLFNHKGGVSKTTTTYNLGWMLARQNKKVILVDADPQCNLTGLILGDDFDDYYQNHPTDNLKAGIAPAFEATPIPLTANKSYSIAGNEKLMLIPGHIGLSEYEVTLSISHQLSNTIPTLKNLPGAINHYLDLMAVKYEADYILVDMNPSLSSINQNIFCISDFFLVPASPDYFSVMAINSLANILPRWETWGKMARSVFQNSSYPFPTNSPKFLGTIMQNFTIRNGEPTEAFQKWIDDVGKTVTDNLVSALTPEGMMLDASEYQPNQITNGYMLAKISSFTGLIARAQLGRIPVFEVPESMLGTGPILEQYRTSKDRFYGIFFNLATSVISMTL